MKATATVAIAVMALGAWAGAQQSPKPKRVAMPAATKTAMPRPASAPAVYMSGADFDHILKSASQMDQPARVVDAGGYRVGVFLIHRLADSDQGCTIEHDTMKLNTTTEVWRVLDGAGTLVTGGTLVDAVPMAADDPDLPLLGQGERGSPIRGGESRRIAKGDVLIVPAGVPHGFSAIEGSITLLVVRIDPARTLPIK